MRMFMGFPGEVASNDSGVNAVLIFHSNIVGFAAGNAKMGKGLQRYVQAARTRSCAVS